MYQLLAKRAKVKQVYLAMTDLGWMPGWVEGAPPPASTAVESHCKDLARADFSNLQDAAIWVTGMELVRASEGAPTYCRVEGYVAPQLDVEIRLPSSNWNGKFLALSQAWLCLHADLP
jgi:feruloyl esterase